MALLTTCLAARDSRSISSEAGSRPHSFQQSVILPVCWTLSATYIAAYARWGWVPHDEGTIAGNAERFLHGSLPHRDFVDVYTGGLTMLNAVSLRLWGDNLLSPRITLFLFTLAWLPVVYWLARRFVAPWIAAAVTFVAVVWSFPNYFAALPSWYNLIFATFAAAAVIRYAETTARRWLMLAGLCAGASILAKISGVFLLAALLLYMVDLEREQAAAGREGPFRSVSYAAFVTVALLAFLGGLAATLGQQRATVLYHFFVPAALVAAYLLWMEWGGAAPGGLMQRLGRLVGLCGPLLVGAAAPLGIFLIPFLEAHALRELFNGVFILPQKRVTLVNIPPPDLAATFIGTAPILALTVVRAVGRAPWYVHALAAGALCGLVPFYEAAFIFTFLMARAAVPVVVAAGLLLAAGVGVRQGAPPAARQAMIALVFLLALCSLVQFPFAAPIYFCYIAPLVALASASVLSLRAYRPTVAIATLATFAGAFGAVWLNRSFLPTGALSQGRYVQRSTPAKLALARGGIKVSAADSTTYLSIAELVREHAGGEYIWAGPDASQVYFLTGKRNPTRSDYEIFDDPVGADTRLLKVLDVHAIRLVAINRLPLVSPPLDSALVRQLRTRFPESRTVGGFTIAWRR